MGLPKPGRVRQRCAAFTQLLPGAYKLAPQIICAASIMGGEQNVTVPFDPIGGHGPRGETKATGIER